MQEACFKEVHETKSDYKEFIVIMETPNAGKEAASEQEASDTLAQLKSPLKLGDVDGLRGRHRFYRHRKMSFPAVSLTLNRGNFLYSLC